MCAQRSADAVGIILISSALITHDSSHHEGISRKPSCKRVSIKTFGRTTDQANLPLFFFPGATLGRCWFQYKAHNKPRFTSGQVRFLGPARRNFKCQRCKDQLYCDAIRETLTILNQNVDIPHLCILMHNRQCTHCIFISERLGFCLPLRRSVWSALPGTSRPRWLHCNLGFPCKRLHGRFPLLMLPFFWSKHWAAEVWKNRNPGLAQSWKSPLPSRGEKRSNQAVVVLASPLV